jgi:hypothetical protein
MGRFGRKPAVPEAYREADRVARRFHAALALHDLIQVRALVLDGPPTASCSC